MTDRDAALRLDAALDDLRSGELSDDPLAVVATTLQELDLRQHATPADTFRTQLRQSLFASSNGVHHLSAADEPVALMPPRPAPRRTAQPNKSHRFLAFAAALLLLFGGIGAITRLPIGDQRDPEPSAIPAAFAEASPTDSDETFGGIPSAPIQVWPSANAPLVVANDTVYLFRSNGQFTGLSAERAEDSKQLWQVEGAAAGKLAVDGHAAYVSFDTGDSREARVEAYSVEDGESLWIWDAGGNITGLTVADGTVYASATDGVLSAIDAESGEMRWRTQIDNGASKDATVWGDRSVQVSGEFVAALSPGGTFAVLGTSDGSDVWSLDGLDPQGTTFAVTTSAVILFEQQTYSYPSLETPENGTAIAEAVTTTFWQTTTYDLAFGGFFGTRGFQELSAQPVAIGNLVAIAATAVMHSATGGGGRTGLFGINGWGGGIVQVAMPEPLKGKRITQLGVWAPPDGVPEQFVVVTEDGVLALVAPKHIGVVDNADAPDPYDGAIVDLGQPAISAPVGDENGLWVVLADGTLTNIHPDRLSGQPAATPVSGAESAIAADWTVDAPEGAGEQWTALHAVSDGHIYRMVGMKLGWSHLQAIDMSDGAVVWDIPLSISVSAMQPYDDLLVIAGQDGESLGFDYPLVALDPRTGEEVWRTTLSQLPVGMVIRGDTAFLLGADNYLDAIDLTTQETIFASDLRGESQPFDAIPDHAHTRVNRLVMVSNTLVAVLADGSLVGVDPHTGAGTWWRLTDVPRRVEVYEIDGSLVTVDQGSWAHLQDGEALVAATPVPMEETSSASCLAVVGSIGPDGSATGVPEASWWQSFAGVDAETGDTVWRAGRIGANYRELTDTEGMILIANVPSADVPESRADMVVCHLDAQRGAVTQIDDLSALIDETFILTDPQDPGSALGFGVFENGGYLALPVELVPEWTGPIIDLSFDPAYPGVAWIEVVDGDSYLALNDGRLVKLIGET